MSPSSNSPLFPPKQSDTGSATGSRESGGSGTTPSSPFGHKTGESGFSSRFAAPTLKPAGANTPHQSPASGTLGNPFSKPAQSPSSPFGKPATPPATSPFGKPAATPSSSPFGKPATPPSPLFGKQPATPASPFAKPATPPSPSPFGKPATPPSPFGKTSGTTPSTTGSAFSKPTSAFGTPTSPFGKAGSQGTGAGTTAPGISSFGKPAAQTPAFGAQKTAGTGTTPLSSRLGQQPTFRPTALLKKNADGEGPSSPFRSTSSAALDGGKPTSLGSLFRPASGQQTTAGGSGLSGFRPRTATTTTATTTPFRKDLKISDEEFIQLRDFIYQQCGIFIAENRKYLVENRLSNRIKDLNLKSYSEYYNFLRFDAGRREELNKLFEVVTTNETSFFRNPPQLKVFQDYVLAEVIAACRQSGRKRIRIWSAGCSTGEEPYTLAIILHEVLKGELPSWDIKITANDLSEAVLTAARRGVYNEYALRTTPPEIIRTYFTKEGTTYKINPSLKRLVSFGQINLSDREQLRRVEKSQIVFCRNVIIYFDDEMKRKVIGAFYDNLEPNGMLLIGHSESLHNISRAFKPEHHTGTIVYRKLG